MIKHKMNQQIPANPQDPYGFIFDNKKQHKAGFGGSKKDRILVVVGGLVVLVAVAAILAAVLAGGGDKTGTALLDIAQKQAELIRVSDLGASKARSTTTQNFAVTTKATIETDQLTTAALLKKAKVKTDPKVLAGGKDSKTDVLLTQAQQNNEFDKVFNSSMATQLKAYQASLQKVYNDTSNKQTKALIKQQYTNVDVLLSAITTDKSTTEL